MLICSLVREKKKKKGLESLPEAPSTQTWNKGEQTCTVLCLLQLPCVGHSCGTVAGFFKVKDIQEQHTDCKMSYVREQSPCGVQST